MNTPLEITFHNLMSSPALEAEIEKRVAKLEKLYPRLTSVRVSVEKPHRQNRTSSVFEVHVEMSVPGRVLAVTREPKRARQRFTKPTIHTSLNDAFRVAEAQLKEFKALQRGAVKTHPAMLHGSVRRVDRRNGRGFLTTNDGKEMYFHRNSLLGGDFEKLKRGDLVQYTEALGDTGPTANKVWVGAQSG
jgi:cold shock CspA family protein/ribosome-associated translation inhibitor RaiA